MKDHGKINSYCDGNMPNGDYERGRAAERAEWVRDVGAMRMALHSLYDAYCSVMRSEFDFPGRPWTPQRDGDEAAIAAQNTLATVDARLASASGEQAAQAAPATAQDERPSYAGFRCMCVETGCRAGPGCPQYDANCKAQIAARQQESAAAPATEEDKAIYKSIADNYLASTQPAAPAERAALSDEEIDALFLSFAYRGIPPYVRVEQDSFRKLFRAIEAILITQGTKP